MKKTCHVLGAFAGLLCLLLLCGCGETVKLEPYPVSGYVVMRGDTAEKAEVSAAVELLTAVQATCPDIDLTTDWVKRGEEVPADGREILVGTTNRPESAAAKETLRVDDFTIRREGERILVLGGSAEATAEAVEYFIAECIGDGGNLLLPPEGSDYTHRGEYPLDALTLNGRSIREYSLQIPPYAAAAERAAAERLLAQISDMSGWMLNVVEKLDAEGPAIRVLVDDRGEADSWQITTDGDSVVISGNGRCSRLLALNRLGECFAPEGTKRELDVSFAAPMAESFEAAPLISFNLPEAYPAMKLAAAEDGGVWEAFETAVAELPEEVTVLERFRPEDYPLSMNHQIFVSPDGDDAAAGTADTPLASPQAAIDRLTGTGGGVVRLKGGTYSLTSSLKLSAVHSGTDLSPTFITAAEGETVTLTAGIALDKADFKPVTANTPRINAGSAKNILVCDLAAMGYSGVDLGKFTTSIRPLLYLDGVKQTIARYPNEGDAEILMGAVVDPGKTTSAHSANYAANKDKTDGWVLKLSDDRPKSWEQTGNIWIYGAVYAEWNKQHYPVTFDFAGGTISSKEYCQYGARFQDDNFYYFYNVLEELDAPGEWFLDQKNGKLYLYPDGDFTSASLVVNDDPIILCEKTENVILRGLTVTGTMGYGIHIKDAVQNVVQDCKIELCGQSGLYVNESIRTGTAYTGFSGNGSPQCRIVSGSNRAALTPDNCFVQNCTFRGPAHNATYTGGVGVVVSHNYIEGAQSFVTTSNECIFEYNEYKSGSLDTADAGMIYVGGSDRSSRGNHLRYNYFHDMAASHAAVYIDDCSSGQYVYGNIVDVRNTDTSTFSGKMTYRLHNGRECVFYNNISIGATRSAFSDNANYYNPTSIRWAAIRTQFVERGEKLAESKVFAARYPIFAVHFERILQHLEDIKAEGYTRNALEEELREPAHNVYKGNIVVNSPKPFDISEAGLRTAAGIDENYVSETSPLDASYQVKDKAVLDKIPGYKDVPFAKMGLVD